MSDEKITKGVKVVVCTVLLLGGMLLGGLVAPAGHSMANGFILLVSRGFGAADCPSRNILCAPVTSVVKFLSKVPLDRFLVYGRCGSSPRSPR